MEISMECKEVIFADWHYLECKRKIWHIGWLSVRIVSDKFDVLGFSMEQAQPSVRIYFEISWFHLSEFSSSHAQQTQINYLINIYTPQNISSLQSKHAL